MKTINLRNSATAVLLCLATFAVTSCDEDDDNGTTLPANAHDAIGIRSFSTVQCRKTELVNAV